MTNYRLNNLDYCIQYLLRQNNAEAEVPATLEGKQRLLRVLMNIWHPQPLSEEFLQAQDTELQAQLMDKGVVSVNTAFRREHTAATIVNSQYTRLCLWQGDITRLKVDAIVNAANNQGLGCWHPLHACIDNAIHSAAGLQLRQECNKILQGDEIATGGAIITPAYNLPAKYVIHTVGPVVAGDEPIVGHEQMLAGCYRSCLCLARDFNLRSIAFCCISTGEYHFPNRRAAEVAVDVVRKHLASSLQTGSLRTVVFNVFKDVDLAAYRDVLGAR